MNLADKLAFYERLAAELKRLGMTPHVPKLRALYAATKRGRTLTGEGVWDHEHAVSVARMLRVPPHETDWPVRPRSSGCGCETPRPRTFAVFPGGHVSKCDGCKGTWIELYES